MQTFGARSIPSVRAPELKHARSQTAVHRNYFHAKIFAGKKNLVFLFFKVELRNACAKNVQSREDFVRRKYKAFLPSLTKPPLNPGVFFVNLRRISRFTFSFRAIGIFFLQRATAASSRRCTAKSLMPDRLWSARSAFHHRRIRPSQSAFLCLCPALVDSFRYFSIFRAKTTHKQATVKILSNSTHQDGRRCRAWLVLMNDRVRQEANLNHASLFGPCQSSKLTTTVEGEPHHLSFPKYPPINSLMSTNLISAANKPEIFWQGPLSNPKGNHGGFLSSNTSSNIMLFYYNNGK